MQSATSAAKAYAYDAFGVERAPVASDRNPFRYCGEYFDLETNTVYLRARSYSPTTGRFLSEDIARDGLNWYTYCYNNPIIYRDANGMKPYTYSVGNPWSENNLYSFMVTPGWYDGMKTAGGFVAFANPTHDGVMWLAEGWVAMDNSFANTVASVTIDTLSEFTEWGKNLDYIGKAMNAIDAAMYIDYMLSTEHAVDQAMFNHIKPKNNNYFLSTSRTGAENKFNNVKGFFRDLVLKGELEVKLGSEIIKKEHYIGSYFFDPLTGDAVLKIYDDQYYFIAPENKWGYYHDWILYEMGRLGKEK